MAMMVVVVVVGCVLRVDFSNKPRSNSRTDEQGSQGTETNYDIIPSLTCDTHLGCLLAQYRTLRAYSKHPFG